MLQSLPAPTQIGISTTYRNGIDTLIIEVDRVFAVAAPMVFDESHTDVVWGKAWQKIT